MNSERSNRRVKTLGRLVIRRCGRSGPAARSPAQTPDRGTGLIAAEHQMDSSVSAGDPVLEPPRLSLKARQDRTDVNVHL